jgi:branched-chain amino acid transport system ATP-binding protein
VALLQTIGLTKRFGDFVAVNSVNFTVNKGEFLSLVGSNGAGKTTLVNLISAQLSPDGGKILFEDRDITASSVAERIRAGIARSFQLVNLFDGLSVLDNVALAIFSRERKVRCSPAASPRASASCSTSPSPTPCSPKSCSSTSQPAGLAPATRRRSWIRSRPWSGPAPSRRW